MQNISASVLYVVATLVVSKKMWTHFEMVLNF